MLEKIHLEVQQVSQLVRPLFLLVQLALGDCRLAGLDVDLAVLYGSWDVGLLSELGLIVGVVKGGALLVLIDFL